MYVRVWKYIYIYMFTTHTCIRRVQRGGVFLFLSFREVKKNQTTKFYFGNAQKRSGVGSVARRWRKTEIWRLKTRGEIKSHPLLLPDGPKVSFFLSWMSDKKERIIHFFKAKEENKKEIGDLNLRLLLPLEHFGNGERLCYNSDAMAISSMYTIRVTTLFASLSLFLPYMLYSSSICSDVFVCLYIYEPRSEVS